MLNATDQMSNVSLEPSHKLRPAVTSAHALNGGSASGDRYADHLTTLIEESIPSPGFR